jgi:hypothetical protein
MPATIATRWSGWPRSSCRGTGADVDRGQEVSHFRGQD